MAETLLKQIQINLKNKGGTANQYQLTLNVFQTGDDNIAGNYTPVRLELWLKSLKSYYSGISGINGDIKIWTNQNQVWDTKATGSVSTVGNGASVQVCSWSGNIPHNSDGSVYIRVQGSLTNSKSTSYTPANGTCDTGDFWLNTIPRYANITTWQVTSKTETSVTCQWGADASCDWMQYSLNNGGWTDWSGYPYVTLSGLSPNTYYNLRLRVRRQDSQLWSESGYIDFTTYDYPKPTNATDFTIGSSCTVTVSNPLGRSYTLDLISNNNGAVIGSYSGTINGNIVGFNDSNSADKMYQSIPNSKSGTYYARVTYSGNTRTYGNKTYYANENDCCPQPSITSVVDTNSTTTTLTGNNNKIIKGYSKARVNFKSGNNSVRKYAGVSSVTVNGYGANAGDTTYEFTNSSARTYTVTVTDTRGYSMSATFTVTDGNWINYTELTIKPIVERHTATDGKIDFSAKGNFFNSSFGATDNDLQVKYRYKNRNEQDYGDWINISTITKSTSTFEISKYTINGTFDYKNSYDFQIQATDSLLTKTVDAIVSGGEPVLWWNKENVQVNGKLKGKIINCSTNEQVIGTWINGQPLYQKTIFLNSLPSAGVEKTYQHNIQNVAMIWIDASNSFIINGLEFNPITWVHPLAVTTNNFSKNNGITIDAATTTTVRVNVGGQSRETCMAYITLRYTKTTD